MHNLEIEFKQLLNKKQYNQMLQDFSDYNQSTYYQTNYYLTHPNLDSRRISLRVREKGDQFELTLKMPQKVGLMETNIDITAEQFDRIKEGEFLENEIFATLRHLEVDELATDLYLTTRRSDMHIPEGLLSLDANEYLGRTDYEVELEVEDYEKGLEFFVTLMKKYDIDYQANCDSKIKRLKTQAAKIKK